MAQKLKQIDIVQRGKRWVGERKGTKRVYVHGSTKRVAVRRAARKRSVIRAMCRFGSTAVMAASKRKERSAWPTRCLARAG